MRFNTITSSKDTNTLLFKTVTFSMNPQ